MALLIVPLQRDNRKQDEREWGDTQRRAPGRDWSPGPLQPERTMWSL